MRSFYINYKIVDLIHFILGKENMIKVGKRKCRIRRRKKKTTPNLPPQLPELPVEVTANILHRLGVVEILETAQKVCTNWRRVCKDPSMWRVIHMSYPALDFMDYNLEIMCRHAVDCSQGQLMDISIEHFGTDELLFYIGERCNHLKSLRLTRCYDISSQGLTEAVKKFPELQELHLLYMTSVIDTDIESLGTSCPNLKLFAYHTRSHNFFITSAECNGIAMAVAKSMPNLLHLQLVRDTMENEGLEAVLNCCSRLESLDIRRCVSIDQSGDLGKRCSKQIKNLRCPKECTDEYDWESDCNDREFSLSQHSYGCYDSSDDCPIDNGIDLYDDYGINYQIDFNRDVYDFCDDYGINFCDD